MHTTDRTRRHLTTVTALGQLASLAMLALLAMLSTTVVQAAGPSPSSLKATASPGWKTYTRDKVNQMPNGNWARLAFKANPKSIRYNVRGNQGTVSVSGTHNASAGVPSRKAAMTAPWIQQAPIVLIIHYTWRKDHWQKGQVEWKPPAR